MIKRFVKYNLIKRFVMLMGVLLCFASLYQLNVYADPSDTKERMEEAKKEKEEKKKELDEAKKQLASTQSGLASLADVKNTYEGRLKNLNGELQEVADNLAVIETSLELKAMEIDETRALLDESIAKCENQYESMKMRIKFLYESEEYTYLEMLFSADNFGEFLNYADYIEQLSAYDRKMLNEYIDTQAQVEVHKQQLEEEYAQIEVLKDDAEKEHGRVSQLIASTADSLQDTAESIDALEDMQEAYEEECNKKADEAAQAAAEYEAIKAQYEEELRLSELAKKSSWRDISEVTFDEGDKYLLANLIYCEAGGEIYEGKVAVGAVVINRVLSSRYPDTITGVIYQNKQFSPVGDGHLALALANNRATEECYSAAEAAMSGVTNVGNCLYFRTPIEGLTGIQIGGHIFY